MSDIGRSVEAQAEIDAQAEVNSPTGRRQTARAVEHALRSEEAVARYHRGEVRARAFAKARSEAIAEGIAEARKERGG